MAVRPGVGLMQLAQPRHNRKLASRREPPPDGLCPYAQEYRARRSSPPASSSGPTSNEEAFCPPGMTSGGFRTSMAGSEEDTINGVLLAHQQAVLLLGGGSVPDEPPCPVSDSAGQQFPQSLAFMSSAGLGLRRLDLEISGQRDVAAVCSLDMASKSVDARRLSSNSTSGGRSGWWHGVYEEQGESEQAHDMFRTTY